MKPKVLFLMQLPPPVHGASVVNKTIKDSEVINGAFKARYVDLSPAKSMNDLGKITPSKLLRFISIFFESILTFLRYKPALVYMTLSPHGAAFYKDSLILILIKMLGGKVVVHMHGKGVRSTAKRSTLLQWYYKFAFKGVAVIHLSKSLFKDLDGIRDTDSKIYELNNGIPDAGYGLKKGTHSEVLNLIYLSNFVRTKGADTLLNAINLLPGEYQGRFKLKLVGGFPDAGFKGEIEKLVKDVFSSDVDIVGPLYGEEKEKALNDASVFILPTRFKNECFPLSILEAMSFRLAIISTHEGAIPDMVLNGENGFVVDREDEQALADRIKEYISNPLLSSNHGNRSRDFFEAKYTLENFENRLLSILNEVIES